MAQLFGGGPLPFGSDATLTPSSATTAASVTTSPWTKASVSAVAWAAGPEAGIVPRFNRLYQQEAGAPQFVRTTDAVN